MAKDIHTPINITVEPRIRAILLSNKDNPDEPLEVADIQTLIKATSRYINTLRHRITTLENKVVRQKHKLTEYENAKEKGE